MWIVPVIKFAVMIGSSVATMIDIYKFADDKKIIVKVKEYWKKLRGK